MEENLAQGAVWLSRPRNSFPPKAITKARARGWARRPGCMEAPSRPGWALRQTVAPSWDVVFSSLRWEQRSICCLCRGQTEQPTGEGMRSTGLCSCRTIVPVPPRHTPPFSQRPPAPTSSSLHLLPASPLQDSVQIAAQEPLTEAGRELSVLSLCSGTGSRGRGARAWTRAGGLDRPGTSVRAGGSPLAGLGPLALL